MMFAAWGRFVYRNRWTTLIFSFVLLAATIGAILHGGSLGTTNSTTTESGRAATLLANELPHTSGSSFSLVFSSATQHVTDPHYRAAMEAALVPLQKDARVQSIRTPYSLPPAQAAAFVSRDGRDALAVVGLKDDRSVARNYYVTLRNLVQSSTLKIQSTGDLALNYDIQKTLHKDLQRAEKLSFPMAMILLLLVFGAVVAALLPLGVGGLTVAGGIGGVYLLSQITDVSDYALNIVTLIGLGVAFDYSLFIVNRFREELARGSSVEASLSRAIATAGRAITFSGITVAIGLAGLLFYQGTILASMGLAGTLSVGFAVIYALTFLPALLAILGPRVNAARLPLPRSTSERGFWFALASWVTRRPIIVLAGALVFVCAAGIPFLNIRLAQSGVSILPPQAESYQGYETLVNQFPGQDKTQINVVVQFAGNGPLLTALHVGALYDLSRRIAALPNVLRMQSLVDLDPSLNKVAYQAMYSGPVATLPAAVQSMLKNSVGGRIVSLTALTARQSDSDQARAIVHSIRDTMRNAVPGAQVLVAGTTAADIDSIDQILSHTPAAVGFIMLMTYLVLFLLVGSVVLPLKALVTDVLSISASFGALVWIFQEGHLSTVLNFTPSSIDPIVPVLLFCIVFGLSMDYEVLLLSRMKEEYDRCGDTQQAIVEGINRSGRLITGAALIMIAVFVSFGLADTNIIKAIGLGMAIAVAVDATVVRALMVPAMMQIMGRLNWWAPRPLAHLHRRLNLAETERLVGEAA